MFLAEETAGAKALGWACQVFSENTSRSSWAERRGEQDRRSEKVVKGLVAFPVGTLALTLSELALTLSEMPLTLSEMGLGRVLSSRGLRSHLGFTSKVASGDVNFQ